MKLTDQGLFISRTNHGLILLPVSVRVLPMLLAVRTEESQKHLLRGISR